MPITLRKFETAVKDPLTGNMVPAGLLSSDALGAINTAKVDAVNTINATGAAVNASLPQTWDDLNDEVDDLSDYLAFDEQLINKGRRPVLATELVPGGWNYGTPTSDATKARTQVLFPVHAGMTITYTVSSYEVFFGVLATPTSNAYTEFGQWKSSSGTATVTKDGYLVFMIRYKLDNTQSITPSAWNGSFVITVRGLARGIIPDGTDFNTIKEPGIYSISSSASPAYVHYPFPVGNLDGTLEVFYGDTRCVQRATRAGNGDTYVRTGYGTSNNFNGVEWSYIPSVGRNVIPDATDFDNVFTVGTYYISNVATANYTHCPLSSGETGMLEVIEGGSAKRIQRVTNELNGEVHIRPSAANGTFAGKDWIHVGVNSTILVSTNDSTDRTADIQAMLTAFGYCCLGPGDFYTTGITLADGQSIAGAGKGTTLYLSSSVTNGAAITLGNYCSAKDLTIIGGGSPITPTYILGYRNGILCEGTAVSSDGWASISNVDIQNFNRGGITCASTASWGTFNVFASDCHIYRCNVGLNIDSNSKMHHFTNIIVTGCYCACISDGIDQEYVNCDFSGNAVGLSITNPGAGATFSGCTFCHFGSNDDGNAVSITTTTVGTVFSGCRFSHGGLSIQQATAVNFIGASLGLATPITISSSKLVIFDNCTISSASASPFSGSNNTRLLFNDCYVRNSTADVYNPVA